MKDVDADAITEYIAQQFDGVDVVLASTEAGSPEVAWGDTFFMHHLDHNFPFATIVTKDYPGFDEASKLDRPGVFRLNIGLSRGTFEALFPEDREHDFAALDRVMPHPVYGRNHWACVLNPCDATFEQLKPLLAEAYERAATRHP